MTGDELRAIRQQLGLTQWNMGRAFGYQGERRNVSTQIRQMESGKRPVPPLTARLAEMFKLYGVPQHFVG